MMVSKDNLIKAVDGDLVKVKSSEKKKEYFLSFHTISNTTQETMLKFLNLRHLSHRDSGDS